MKISLPPKQILLAILILSLLSTRFAAAVQTMGWFDPMTCRSSHFYSESAIGEFWPKYFIDFLKPYSRLATEELSTYGHDIKVGKYQIFGSMAWSLPIDHKLASYFSKQGLIELSETNGTYYFKSPWQIEKLNDLGIQYLIQKSPINEDLTANKWKILAQVEDLFLYSNPQDVSIAFYREPGGRFYISKKNILVRGNGLIIKLPKLDEAKELIITLSFRPGWKAYLDNKEKAISYGEDRMMRVTLHPGNSVLRLQYEPFKNIHFSFFIGGSLLLLLISWKIARLAWFHKNI